MDRFTSITVLPGLATILLAAWAGMRAIQRRADRKFHAAEAAHEATLRLLRLAASDQRNLALTLFGYAQRRQPADSALTGLARRLLDMSEDLTRQTELPCMPRTLAEEGVPLLPVVEFAMAQVAAHLGPSRRAWRIAPDFAETSLLADRRALHQVLVNVLSGAAASTRDGDWIELSARHSPDEWAITVQDEGIGLPVAQNDAHPEESRGIGLQLTLARSLMQAHGGSLTVESTERVGTRVRLGFPAARVLKQAS
jgi:signal transduction histidine kinase